MNASSGKVITVTFAAGLTAALFFVGGSPIVQRSDAEAREVRRVRAHFDSVLSEMVPRDVRRLTPAQQTRRASLILTLAAYRNRGLFPHNYDEPDRMVPSFVDQKTGIRCAVGELLASTGREDIVTRVARENVHVYVAELGTDTAFAAWLDDNGLTLAEASRIQPSYGGNIRIVEPVDARWTNIDLGAAGASALLAEWNLVLNRDGHSTSMNTIGITTGVVALGFGGYSDNRRIVKHSVANLAMGTGALSILVSTVGAVRHARHQDARASMRISVSPWLVPTSMAANRTAGLTARIRF